MTDFDRKLIEKADTFSRWDYRDIDVLIAIRRLLYDHVQETL